MIKVLSHDLRGPLVSLAAAMKLLKKGFYGQMHDGVRDELNNLSQRVTSLIGILEEFLARVLLNNGDESILKETLRLQKDILEPVLYEIAAETGNGRIIIEDDQTGHGKGDVAVQGNKFFLKAVFRNLLRNAVIYGGKSCKIAVGFKSQGQYIRINVYNSGVPVPEELRDLLFTKFARVSPEATQNSGMGFGLYMVKRIIQNEGGSIWYEAVKSGSNFVFTLPRK
jgi:signal transduction histidine kinase